MLECIFKHTTTLGVREYVCKRYELGRSEKAVRTQDGEVRVKISSGYGVVREKGRVRGPRGPCAQKAEKPSRK